MQLPFLCEKSGAIAPVLPHLAGKQADKTLLNLEIVRIEIVRIKYQMNIQFFVVFDKGTVLLYIVVPASPCSGLCDYFSSTQLVSLCLKDGYNPTRTYSFTKSPLVCTTCNIL